jgi:hypothetical protein
MYHSFSILTAHILTRRQPNGFDLGLNFGDDSGALENFDFDSFLHTGNDNDAFGNLVSDFDFPNAAEV